MNIKRDLEYIEKEARRLKIIGKANDELEKNSATVTKGDGEISAHWIDKFNELAKSRNEGWREDLLMKALVAEAKQPGSIGPQTLWFIGTMEEQVFHIFSALLDCCVYSNGSYYIPNIYNYLDSKISVNGLAEQRALSNLIFLLNEFGLFGEIDSTITLPSEEPCEISYGGKKKSILLENDVAFNGLMTSVSGARVARLCKKNKCELGEKIYSDMLVFLRTDQKNKR